MCATRLCVTSWLLRTVLCLCSNVFIAYRLRPRPWMRLPIWSPTGSGWTSGPSFSPPQRTLHFSWRTGSIAKCRTLSRMKIGPCLATNLNSFTTKYEEARLQPRPRFVWLEWWLNGYRWMSVYKGTAIRESSIRKRLGKSSKLGMLIR